MSPDDAAALVAEEHGLELAVVRPLGGGAVGAHEVTWSGGGRAVMKQLVDRRDRLRALRALRLVEHLRAVG